MSNVSLMATAPEDRAASEIVGAVCTAFVEEAAAVDEILLRAGYDMDAYFTWIERFSQRTADSIKHKDFGKATGHLKLVSRLLDPRSQANIQCIDVAYVESLMWDIKGEKLKREGWRLMPSNLRDLYVAMWGECTFMRGVK
jgi:hypothetical protein